MYEIGFLTDKTSEMKYLRPRLPEKEIELCLDLFDKAESKKRILDYIASVFDDAESQLKNCSIPAVVGQGEQCTHPRDQREYIGSNMLRCKLCGKEFS